MALDASFFVTKVEIVTTHSLQSHDQLLADEIRQTSHMKGQRKYANSKEALIVGNNSIQVEM